MGFEPIEDGLRCPQCLRYFDKGIRACSWCNVRLRRADAVEDEPEAGTEAEHVAAQEVQRAAEAQEARPAAPPTPEAPTSPEPPPIAAPDERRSRRER